MLQYLPATGCGTSCPICPPLGSLLSCRFFALLTDCRIFWDNGERATRWVLGPFILALSLLLKYRYTVWSSCQCMRKNYPVLMCLRRPCVNSCSNLPHVHPRVLITPLTFNWQVNLNVECLWAVFASFLVTCTYLPENGRFSCGPLRFSEQMQGILRIHAGSVVFVWVSIAVDVYLAGNVVEWELKALDDGWGAY